MKKFTKTKIARNVCMGGVIFSAILALSLMFASCDNPSDTNSGNGDSTGITDNNGTGNSNSNNSNNNNNSNGNNNSNSSNNSGNNNNSNNSNLNGNNNNNSGDNNNNNSGNAENLIKKTIRLVSENDSDCYLELKTDGTARYIDLHNDKEDIKAEFKYTYNENKKELYMKLEKYRDDGFEDNDLLTYDELRSKINGMEVEDDYAEEFRQMYEGIYKAKFSAQITYAYEINDGKMTLAEKFTGVKNLFNSECRFSDGTDYLGISCDAAYLHFGDDDGDSIAYLGTDNKTINFSAKNITATYTENLAKETVTISFDGKDYVCKFEGETFTQLE